MEANELMIGDWVYFHNGTVVEPRRVTGVLIPDCIYLDFGYEPHTNLQTISLVEPIPLTAEILEKNGFTHSFGDSDFYDYEKWEKKVDDKTIRVIKDNDGWFCRVDDNKLTNSMGIAPDVHTMQHIIRIGGIDKTIEL